MFIGEHRDDDDHLLVKGADGTYYDYGLAQDRLEPVEPDEQTWEIVSPEPEETETPPPVAPEEMDFT